MKNFQGGTCHCFCICKSSYIKYCFCIFTGIWEVYKGCKWLHVYWKCS